MRETRVRAALGLAVVVLCLAGFVSVQAAESGGAPSAGELGNVWYADPPYTPAGALATATWTAPEPFADAPAPEVSPSDLPPDVPQAAREPEPVLPTPSTWTFGDGFPRTSGTGRYFNGAYFWSDFIYDDNGAVGANAPANESGGAPSFGTYQYPEPEALRNGADIFRVAVGREADETTWRVDWNTLVDPTLPIAVFTIDSDNDSNTGATAWPANAGLLSPGIDWAIVMSGTSAQVIQLGQVPISSTSHDVTQTLEVDMNARSFVVRTSLIPLGSTAVVRVAAGLADAAGTGFLTLDPLHGAAPGQPNVYNVAFRDYADEPSQTNTWYDTGQARALTAGGQVSDFGASIDWDLLAQDHTDAERLLPGYTNRWYVSTWKPTPSESNPNPPDQGIVSSDAVISTDDDAAYRGRVQPYGIYVPTSYPTDTKAPLTWMLHGALSSHNSTQVHPRFLELACERRKSICVSPLGRGPSGGWRNYAELDFWQVWNRVAAAYSLDPDRTIISGNSMGAFGTYKIAMDHPEAFAGAISIVGNATAKERGLDRLVNLRWMQLYARHGEADELVPIATEEETQAELNKLKLRHVYDFYPAEDHIVVALKDAYDDVAEFMTTVDTRMQRPPRINYVWRAPTAFDIDNKIIRTGAWWLKGVAMRPDDDTASIEATSLAIEDPEVTYDEHDENRVLASPSPAMRHVLNWVPTGVVPKTSQALRATLLNVAALTIDLPFAGLGAGSATLTVTTDGPSTLTLEGLVGRKVRLDGKVVKGNVLPLAVGSHEITLR